MHTDKRKCGDSGGIMLQNKPERYVKSGQSKGFSLIELMVALVIFAIISGVAIGSYRNSVMKSNRSVAKAALLDLAAREEKYFAFNNAYTSSLTALFPLMSAAATSYSAPASGTSMYTITIASVTAATASAAPAFSVTATPIPTGPQANDTQCTSFTLSNTGVQTYAGTGTPSICW